MAYPKRFLHTMLRVTDLSRAIAFYTKMLGMTVLRQKDYPLGQFTLVFLGYGEESTNTVLELTYNWGVTAYARGTGYGHLALAVDDIYATCEMLAARAVPITRPPGPMKADANEIIAFIEDPDGYKIELIERA